jgi:AcrR family transcriptional regulator
MTTTSTRERIVRAAAEAFQRQGFTGTGLKQISTESRAPFGSLYHFFPGGKTELAGETLRFAGLGYQQLVEAVWDAAPDVVSAVRAMFDGAAETLRGSDYADACPIATVALEVASTNETLRAVTADVFDDWLASLTARLEAGGVPPARTRELAMLILASLEGGFLLSRAAKSTESMEAIGRCVAAAVSASLDDAPRPTPSRRSARARTAGPSGSETG